MEIKSRGETATGSNVLVHLPVRDDKCISADERSGNSHILADQRIELAVEFERIRSRASQKVIAFGSAKEDCLVLTFRARRERFAYYLAVHLYGHN